MYKTIVYALLIVTLFSCDNQQKKKEELKKDTTVTTMAPATTENKPKINKSVPPEEVVKLNLSSEEQNQLLLINEIPLGSPYSKVIGVMPDLKEIKAAKNEKEAKAVMKLLSYTTEIIFNFSNDSLYSYYYTITERNDNEASRLFAGLQSFYSKNFGEYTTGSVEEEDHYNRSCQWRKNNTLIVLKYDINSSTISWGYQK